MSNEIIASIERLQRELNALRTFNQRQLDRRAARQQAAESDARITFWQQILAETIDFLGLMKAGELAHKSGRIGMTRPADFDWERFYTDLDCVRVERGYATWYACWRAMPASIPYIRTYIKDRKPMNLRNCLVLSKWAGLHCEKYFTTLQAVEGIESRNEPDHE